MSRAATKKILILLVVFLSAWFTVRYLLPLVMPFVLGALLAVAAEPMVRFLKGRLRLPRGAAAGIGVSLSLVLLCGSVVLVLSVLLRELGQLAQVLPDLESTARDGLQLVQDRLLSLAGYAPEAVRPLLIRSVLALLGGSSAFVERLVSQLPGVVTSVLSHIPDGFLSIGTAVISAFLISGRLPRLRHIFAERMPKNWKNKYAPAIRQMRRAAAGWLKAQFKLMGLTFLVVLMGFLVLQIPYAPVWALGVAVVDAVPVLGTGTVLLPWALISLLQGDTLRAIGLTGVYAVAMLTRSMLEPKLVGKQLGLDPLVTLAALYVGYQFWGILGLLLAPMLAAVAAEFTRAAPRQE